MIVGASVTKIRTLEQRQGLVDRDRIGEHWIARHIWRLTGGRPGHG